MPVALALMLLPACASHPRGGLPRVPEQISPEIARLSDGEVDERLHFLEERLDERRDYAWYWYYGWTSFYGLGVIVEGVRAGTADTDGERADYAVGAVKALGGVANMLIRPIQAQNGADFVRAQPGATPEDRRRQLAVAEDQLRINADEAEARWDWVRHVANLAVNTAGAIIIWKGFDESGRAWRSFGLGTGIGEVMIISAPWKPADDWQAYQQRFDRSPPQVSWRIVPSAGGAAFQLDF